MWASLPFSPLYSFTNNSVQSAHVGYGHVYKREKTVIVLERKDMLRQTRSAMCFLKQVFFCVAKA